jgi:hypothetical protein
VGKHDFSGVVYFGFQTGIQGTLTSYSGEWKTNIVHSDGVTITEIRATWKFTRN